MTLAKPMIPNVRPHDGLKPVTFTHAGNRHQMDVSIGLSDSALNDAFGRLRVSQPLTVFDSKMLHDNSPLYWDDQQVSGSGTTSSLVQICATVVSEGGQDSTGAVRATDTGTTALAANAIGTEYALLGLRLKSTHLDMVVDLLRHDILCATVNDKFLWRWKLNPTVAGTFTYADIANSALQQAIGVASNTVSGGTVVGSGYGQSATVESVDNKSLLSLGSTIAGVSDTLVLCITPVTANQNVHGACMWRELV